MMVKIKRILHARVPPINGRVDARSPPVRDANAEFEDFPVRALSRPPRSREISPRFVRHFTPVVAKARYNIGAFSRCWPTLQPPEGHLTRVCERFANGLARLSCSAMAV